MATGVISLRKSTSEGRRIFKNNRDGIVIVMQKWKESLVRVIFLKDDEIIHSPPEYRYEYNLGDKVETYRKTSDIEGIICWVFGSDSLFRYTIYHKRKRIFQFHSMMQFSVHKPKFIFGYKRKDKKGKKNNEDIFIKIDSILGIIDDTDNDIIM
jgi:hypothetical protein